MKCPPPSPLLLSPFSHARLPLFPLLSPLPLTPPVVNTPMVRSNKKRKGKTNGPTKEDVEEIKEVPTRAIRKTKQK